MVETNCVGTIISDNETPTFEIVRMKMKPDCDLRPGKLIRIPSARGEQVTLIGRVRSAYENNPNVRPEAVGVRDSLGIAPNYPQEKDSTTIYRLIEADLIEEVSGNTMRSPQTLPNAGAEVIVADEGEIARTLGLASSDAIALNIGETISGTITPIRLKREAIQRHFFIGGTTGSAKSYAMGVLTAELIGHGLPVIFLDTQDEYSSLVTKLGGVVLTPGEDFAIRISSLTDRELLDLIPTDSQLQKDIIAASFLELKDELAAQTRPKFTLDDLVARIQQVGPQLTNTNSSVQLAARRTQFLRRNDNIFGDGVAKENWPKHMSVTY
jgi:DNA helicase HerA-like ATPase